MSSANGKCPDQRLVPSIREPQTNRSKIGGGSSWSWSSTGHCGCGWVLTHSEGRLGADPMRLRPFVFGLTCCRVRFGDEVSGDVVRGWESREPAPTPTPTATMPTSDVGVRMSAVALCLVGARSPPQRSGSGRLGKDDRELFPRIGTSSPFRGGCRAARRRPAEPLVPGEAGSYDARPGCDKPH
jgi:hypothetical protein